MSYSVVSRKESVSNYGVHLLRFHTKQTIKFIMMWLKYVQYIIIDVS